MSTVERAPSGAATEVTTKGTRRRFTLDDKRKIVQEAERCKSSGAVGALLRREGAVLVAERAEALIEVPENIAAVPGPPANTGRSS
jgi:hypothetical protein